ncbi:putative RNA methyltransferase [Virgibacillus proomii]|uniref:putative RNA methyltransferase n=1 Tax=Virgibacillus proomii TaxID=84407 RepID=UPI0009853FA4|nr:methyltransferase domain-containing protein [Virgibacillus proomii]
MANKEKSAEMVSENVEVFRCPICHFPVKVFGLKSLVCPNNHTFDFAKQGYVNMMTRPSSSHYDKKLFEARQKIIMKSNLYTFLHEKISEVIGKYLDASHAPAVILDAGCGEGSHLQRILEECNNDSITAIGLDISKEGIVMAAKNYQSPIWLVGDLANAPLEDQSYQVVLNVLSPANYMEFKRILTSDGLIIKVVPRSNYLKELREALFIDKNKRDYDNDEIVSLFKQHFHLEKYFKLSYVKELSQTELMNLVQMTPLAWKSEKEQIDTFIKQNSVGVTVDLDILVGYKRKKRGGK